MVHDVMFSVGAACFAQPVPAAWLVSEPANATHISFDEGTAYIFLL